MGWRTMASKIMGISTFLSLGLLRLKPNRIQIRVSKDEAETDRLAGELPKVVARFPLDRLLNSIAENLCTIGKSKTWVTRILNSFNRGSALVLSAWEDGTLTNEHVQEITKLDEQKQNKQLGKLISHLGGKEKKAGRFA